MFTRVPGTKDILPDQTHLWQSIEAISRDIFSLYNYREIRPPIIEDASLFNRSLGESTEIVQKQMFMIPSAPDVYVLRPEATASIVRAYIENNLDKVCRLAKLYYIGPMFRRERPQKGRLRQFHHIGAEAIGAWLPQIDIEMIALADSLLKAFSIEGYTIKVNSLGCAKDKLALTQALRDNLKERLPDLCVDCQTRFATNVLRILDCKNEGCKKVVDQIGLKGSYLCDECKAHFGEVTGGLESLAIAHEVSAYLVRGLDYYTRTVFEITHPQLGGQQDALGAGGRYDMLVAELGGPEVGAIGFAFGVERLLLASRDRPPATKKDLVYIISLGQEAKIHSVKLLAQLRAARIACDTDYENKSLKGAMRKADDLAVSSVVIIGENELKKHTVMLKCMASGEQKEIPIDNLVEELQKRSH